MLNNVILQQIESPINCANLITSKKTGYTYCQYLTNRVGRLYQCNKPFCNLVCKRSGPYDNKPLDTAAEQAFIERAWVRSKTILNQALAEKVLINYRLPAEIIIPENYNAIKTALQFLTQYDGYNGFMITGSAIVKGTHIPPKDLDIVIRCGNPQTALYLHENKETVLPPTIDGIVADYFIVVDDLPAVSNLYFCCLDVENKKFYSTVWFPVNIKSIPIGFTVEIQPLKMFAALLRDIIPENKWVDINSKIATKLQSTSTPTVAQAGWQSVKDTWQKAHSFLAAAQSRGLKATTLDALNVDSSSGERVSEEIYNQRKLSCFGNNEQPACTELRRPVGKPPFCGACGCSSNRLAILSSEEPGGYTKLHYPYLECPLKKPGFSNAA